MEDEPEPQKNLLTIWTIRWWNSLPGDTEEPHCSSWFKSRQSCNICPRENNFTGARSRDWREQLLFNLLFHYRIWGRTNAADRWKNAQSSHFSSFLQVSVFLLYFSSCSCLFQWSLTIAGKAIFHYNACNDLLMNYSLCFRKDTILICDC